MLGAQAMLLLDRAIGQAERLGRADLAAHLRRERARVVEPTCQVLVVGEFKKGKSALVNALLNARVCAVDADVATAVPTLVRYGPAASAAVVLQDRQDGAATSAAAAAEPGADTEAEPTRPGPDAGPDAGAEPEADAGAEPAGTRRRIPLAAVQSAATEPGQVASHGRIRSVEVEVARGLLRHGLVLIDTPGVFGGLTAAHAAATLRALAMADAVVFVSDAGQEYSAPELDLLRQAAATCPTVVCVLTKTDFYPEWRRILEIDRGHLRRAGLDYEVLPLSAPLRHHALRTGDRGLDAESGYPGLSAHLRRRVLAGKETLAVRSAAASVRASLGQIAVKLAAERTTLADPAATGALMEQLERAERRTDQLRGAAARWQQTLADRFGDMVSNVDMDLAVRLRQIRKEAADRIEDADPTRIWADLERWLYQRTNEGLAAHYNEMRAQADRVAAEVARHFELDAGELAVRVDLGGAEPPTSGLQLGEHHFHKASWVEMSLSVARGSVSSHVLTGMVGTIVAVTTVTAPVTAVLTPVTLVLAAALGRKAVRQAKDAQLRTNRAEAMRTVQLYLEEAELLARKDSRDTLRRVNRRLRDYFSARAQEFHVSASQGLEAAARAVKTDRESRRRRLEQATADLRDLHVLIGAAERLGGAAAAEARR